MKFLTEEEQDLIEACVAYATRHPRDLVSGSIDQAPDLDERNRVTFDNVFVEFTVERVEGGRLARHLAVSIRDQSAHQPAIPELPVVCELARAFGFEGVPAFGTRTGARGFVVHALERVDEP